MTIQLIPKPAIPDTLRLAIVDILKKYLAEAEEGKLLSVIVIAKHPGGAWSDERSGCMDFPDAIGRMEIVKQAWIRAYLERDDGKL